MEFAKSRPDIYVYDQVCGTGKTTKIIDKIRTLDNPVIYITPLLSECARIGGNTIDADGKFVLNDYGYPAVDDSWCLAHKNFKHPNTRNSKASKAESLLSLVRNKDNIASTHALFRQLSPDVLAEIRKHDYILICDEAIEVFEQYKILSMSEDRTYTDIMSLVENGFIHVQSHTGRLSWNYDKFDPTDNIYQECANLCDMGRLFVVNNSLVYLELNIESLNCFKEVWFATYMFEHTFLGCYLKIHDLDYTINYGTVTPAEYRDLINIVDNPRWNEVGDKAQALSSSNSRQPTVKLELKNKLRAFFRTTQQGERIWCCLKDISKTVSGGRYMNDFVPIGTKATNKYNEVKYCAYLYNNYTNPMLKHFIEMRGGVIDQDMWALSELIQYVFRTRIRNKQEITVFIPSKRMRTLLESWLSDNLNHQHRLEIRL